MKKKFFLGLFVVATIGLFVFANIVLKGNTAEKYEGQQNLRTPIEIPAKEVLSIEDAEQLNKPILAMFYVDWCGYCRKYMPIFGEFAKEYKDKYSFVAINCDIPKYRKMVDENNIIAFPTFILFDKEYEYDYTLSQTVVMDKNIMKMTLDKYLKLREKMLRK